ncbi:MAG: hypothetical protein H7Z43_09310 [Clostridia bacterium]|nr:hypothetical protein [Deltaproteobacteria bacterium]
MSSRLCAPFGACAVALGFLTLWHCASQTRLPPTARAQISARHAGTTVELRESCYFGELYDENELWLLSPYAFADTSHIVDLKGEPIHPQGQRDIITAGSRFVIDRVEFPDATALAKRMITTPRYNPWVYLKPVEGSDVSLSGRRGYVVILPAELETEEQVENALSSIFAPEGNVARWLETRRPTVKVAIATKNVFEGMSREEMIASMGMPLLWFIEQSAEGEKRVAWYGSKEVWLKSDAVLAVKDGRPVAHKPRDTVASEAMVAPIQGPRS